MCDRGGRRPNLRLYLGKRVGLSLALWLTQVQLTLPHARQDGGALASLKKQGTPSLLRSGKRQSPGKDFHRPVPVPAASLLCLKLRKQRRQCKHFPFVCKHVLFTRLRVQEEQLELSPLRASPAASGYGAGLLPPRRPRHATARAGDVTRACCTPAISSIRRSPPRKKTSSPSFRTRFSSGAAELRSYFFFLTLATKCKTYPVAFNYMFTPCFSKDITTLP